MAYSSEVTQGLHFLWRTELYFEDLYRKSSIFSFLNSEWQLEMHFGIRWHYVSLQNVTKREDFEPFEVTAWIEDDRKKSDRIGCQRTKVKYETTYIWEMHEYDLLKEIPDFKDYGDFTIVFMLHCVTPPPLKKESKHQSIQVSLDLPFSAESLSLDTRRPLTKLPTTYQAIKPSFEFPPGLEGLSLDLGNLLEEGTMPDVHLKCRDGVVPAHRSVLIARSEVFSEMFRNDAVENRSCVVDMPDINSKVLESLLKYVYTGKLPEVSMNLMRRLYAASHKYAIHSLQKACSEWMTGGMTEKNYLHYLVLADSHDDATFKDAVVAFIVDNEGVVFKSRAWFKFQKRQPKLTIEVLNRCFLKRHRGYAFQRVKNNYMNTDFRRKKA